MTTFTKFSIMTGLPEYGERATIDNVNINDIITNKVKGIWVFSVVIGTTSSLIKVVDLFYEITIDGVNLYINNERNSTKKGTLNPSRKIFKVVNINRL